MSKFALSVNQFLAYGLITAAKRFLNISIKYDSTMEKDGYLTATSVSNYKVQHEANQYSTSVYMAVLERTAELIIQNSL